MKEEAMKKIEIELASIRNTFLEIRKLSLHLDPKNRKEVSKIVNLLNKFSFEVGKISGLTSVVFSNKNIKDFGDSTIGKIYKLKLSIEDNLDLKLLNDSEFYFDQMYNEIEKEILKIVLEPIIVESDSKFLKEKINLIESEIKALKTQVLSLKSTIADLILKEREKFLDDEELSILEEILLLHEQGISWIEPRFLSKNSRILEKLYNYGLLKRKKRGGIDVYSYCKN
ncbi:MAG: hypothetical protein KAT49_00585 [Methanomicrobia archaeon]|nr:hypothetical protein [Methanomicrobia archaeon]